MLLVLLLAQVLALQLNILHGNGAIFLLAADTLHTIIADFLRVEIAAITFTAADTNPVVQNTFLLALHRHSPLMAIS